MTTLCDPPQTSAKPTPPPPTGQILTYVERFECPRCETAIPPDCVSRREPDEAMRRAGFVEIAAYCPACVTAFEATFSDRGGLLHRCGAIHLVTEKGEVDRLKAGIELVRGGRQVRRPVPAEPTAAAVRAEPSAGELEAAALRAAQDDPARRVERVMARMSVELQEIVRSLAAERRTPPVALSAAESAALADVEPPPAPARPDPVVDRSTSQVDERPDPFDVDAQHDR